MAHVRLRGTGRHRAAKPVKGGRQVVALATVLSAAGVQAGVTAGTAEADGARTWTEGPIFNNPLGTTQEQYAIRTRLVELTDAALPGSTIKVAVYHVWEQTIVDALKRAKDRGVRVQIVLDSTSKTDRPENTVYSQLAALFGTSRANGSFVTLCPTGKSCLGDPKFGKSIMHNKFWLFSAVEGATNVVVQTTSNSTPSAHTKFFNDALQLPNNPVLYGAYSDYFDDMVLKDWANWDYRTVSNGHYKAYFFPRAGTTNSTDTLHSVLNNVSCTYKDAATGTTKRTVVRAAVFQITRQAIADKLVSLKKAGCTVQIEYATSDSGTWTSMHSSGAPPVRCYNDPRTSPTTPYIIHTKYVAIDGVYDGARNKITFTGSQNASDPALRENDEAYVKIDDDSVHDTYVQHFNKVWGVAYPGVSDNTSLCKGVKTLPQDGEIKSATKA
ncbi:MULTISPECIES: phospholipase D-like domain-containing protein [unclassified Streptomyces]|uniref:phospholipase D-like domain-containing protein n=1 Tax=unclassified Streptomyces TaxID=2593676 RepID=UPI00278BC3A1|nr:MULTISPECIES: phospholipase D-like domain-containing protein [unclassified Streptomyces]